MADPCDDIGDGGREKERKREREEREREGEEGKVGRDGGEKVQTAFLRAERGAMSPECVTRTTTKFATFR